MFAGFPEFSFIDLCFSIGCLAIFHCFVRFTHTHTILASQYKYMQNVNSHCEVSVSNALMCAHMCVLALAIYFVR